LPYDAIVRLRSLTRVALMLVPVFTCAARIHAHPSEAPDVMMQEVNRTLRLVRVVARRRETPKAFRSLRRGTSPRRDR
jgi:hypothetical protein